MKNIKYFKIMSYYVDGVIAETIRHTREGMNVVIRDLFKDEDVVRFTVEEIV